MPAIRRADQREAGRGRKQNTRAEQRQWQVACLHATEKLCQRELAMLPRWTAAAKRTPCDELLDALGRRSLP